MKSAPRPLWHIKSDMTAFWRQTAAAAAAVHSQASHAEQTNIHIKAHVHKETHVLPHICRHVPIHVYSSLSFSFLPCSLLSFTHPPYFLRSSSWNTKVQSLWLKAQGKGAEWSEYLIWGVKKKKYGAAEYFIKHFWGTPQIWILVASASEPASVSVIIHQPSEEERLHQQALWDSEYLKLHLAQSELHLCSDLLWQCETVWLQRCWETRKEQSDALFCALWEKLKRRCTKHWDWEKIGRFETSLRVICCY